MYIYEVLYYRLYRHEKVKYGECLVRADYNVLYGKNYLEILFCFTVGLTAYCTLGKKSKELFRSHSTWNLHIQL